MRTAAFALLTGAVALAGCDALPPDAVRGPGKLVAGSYGACLLAEGAPMRCWGQTPFTSPDGSFARPSKRPGAVEVALDGGAWSSDAGCVIERGGALECPLAWAGHGRDFFPPLRSAPALRDVRALAMSGAWVCVLGRAEGEGDAVWCRERVASERAVARVDDGWVRADLGEVVGFGLGPRGLCAALRSGRVRCVPRPGGQARDVEGISGAVQVVMGDGLGCARDAGGGVRCFGEVAEGGELRAEAVPLPAPATDLAASHRRACAIANGAPLCWGLLRPEGALPAVFADTPRPVARVDGLQQLALGFRFTCATRSADGTIRCWGYDAEGQLGDGSRLPGASCSREGIDGTSAERERPGGPSVVRTGEAGRHPGWRRPPTVVSALVVVAPLIAALALARASIRSLRSPPAVAARVALIGHGLLAALIVPIALGGVISGVLAAWSGRTEELRFEGWATGRVALATLGPALALVVTGVTFGRIRRAPADGLAEAARRAGVWLVAVAVPALVAAMVVSPRVSERAEEELVYLVRDATQRLSPFFVVWGVCSGAWIVLAGMNALFVGDWARESREATDAARRAAPAPGTEVGGGP